MDVKKLQPELVFEEGNIPYAYKDHLGYLTIGIGFLIDKNKGGRLYPEEIAFIFANRAAKIEAELRKRLPWYDDLDDARQRVLMQMAWQMGVEGLMKFVNTLKFVQQGKYREAAAGMLQSLWAQQTPDRANRLSKMMATGIPPAQYGTT